VQMSAGFSPALTRTPSAASFERWHKVLPWGKKHPHFFSNSEVTTGPCDIQTQLSSHIMLTASKLPAAG